MRKNLVLTKGTPDRLASGSIQHGLFSGNADFELHGLHLGPVELGQRRGGGEEEGNVTDKPKETFHELLPRKGLSRELRTRFAGNGEGLSGGNDCLQLPGLQRKHEDGRRAGRADLGSPPQQQPDLLTPSFHR